MPISFWKYQIPSILSSALVSISGQYPDFIGDNHLDGNHWPSLSSLVSTFAIAAFDILFQRHGPTRNAIDHLFRNLRTKIVSRDFDLLLLQFEGPLDAFHCSFGIVRDT
jgi:hypothetical protein